MEFIVVQRFIHYPFMFKTVVWKATITPIIDIISSPEYWNVHRGPWSLSTSICWERQKISNKITET